MATFHSLSPALGSHQSRSAPDLFSIELELELPQDHFLPAQDIQAQVWTNIIHKLNPDGPEVWAALPMKLSHVIPGKSIAVFATRFQPTGRGEFGLTARWKSHRDMTEWQWAPTEIPVSGGHDNQQEKGGNNVSGKGYDDEGKKNRDVSVTVRVPRTIEGTSSWTIGPQSVLVYGEHGLRTSGVVGVGGPGLYLGNHAAATRARISGYESVLSLVSDLLDFDEKIPESDKDINKNAWMEQAQAASPPKRFSVLSRSSSNAALDATDAEGRPEQQANGSDQQGLNRRSSVTDFMRNYIPGSNSEAIIAGVVNEPVDPPRLGRKSSVTDMMVQPPSTSGGPNSKRLSRSSPSASSIASIDETNAGGAQQEPLATTTTTAANGKSLGKKTSLTNVATSLPPAPTTTATPAAKTSTTPAAGSTPAAAAATTSTPTAPISKKAQKAAEKAAAAEKATAAEKTTAATTATANPSAALPPVSGNSKATTTAGAATEAPTSSSPTVTSLAVSPAPTPTPSAGTPHPLDLSSASPPTPPNADKPPTSAKIVSSLHRQFDSTQALSSLSGDSTTTTTNNSKKQIPFVHKIISVAPGAHNKISDAILKEAVEFLQTELEQGKKVLVHCRDGNGRSGSVAVAYIASQLQKQQPWRNVGETYQQALTEIWKWKCDVYPHKGLRQSVEQIRW